MPETDADHRALAASISRAVAAEVADLIASYNNAGRVAVALGTSMTQVYRLQSGDADPRLTTLARLAELRHMSLPAFLRRLAARSDYRAPRRRAKSGAAHTEAVS